jgi:hypothetical protein
VLASWGRLQRLVRRAAGVRGLRISGAVRTFARGTKTVPSDLPPGTTPQEPISQAKAGALRQVDFLGPCFCRQVLDFSNHGASFLWRVPLNHNQCKPVAIGYTPQPAGSSVVIDYPSFPP